MNSTKIASLTRANRLSNVSGHWLRLCIAVLVLTCPAIYAGPDAEFDIVYGHGDITVNGEIKSRPLLMDAYYPSDPVANVETGLPAVVYVHGGAFHRGGRRKPPYELGAAIHSSPEDWAAFLTRKGYAVFVIEYRLAPENPSVEFSPGEAGTVHDLRSVIAEADMLAFSRARSALGMPALPYTDDGLQLFFDAYMAAVEDATTAVNYLIANSTELGIDPTRLAMGGHSAGGAITLSVGLGMKAPLKAIFPLSPANTIFTTEHLASKSSHPPTLISFAQYDEPALLRMAPVVVNQLQQLEVQYELRWVPGYMHFYPFNSPTLGDDGVTKALGNAVTDWLNRYL